MPTYLDSAPLALQAAAYNPTWYPPPLAASSAVSHLFVYIRVKKVHKGVVVEYARVALRMYIVYVECETEYTSTKLDAIPA